MEERKTGGTAATRAKNKYNAKNYDQFLVTVPAGQKAEIDKHKNDHRTDQKRYTKGRTS